MPVEDYPALPEMPEARRHRRRATSSRTPSPRRSPPPAATTCCRCSPACGSRSTAPRSSLLATDRFRLSPARARPGTRGTPTLDAAALVPAKVLADTAKSLTGGHRGRPSRSATGGAGEGLIGFEGCGRRRRPAYDDPAARRRVPQGALAVPERAPDRRPGRPGRRSSTRSSASRWWPSATPPSSSRFSRRRAHARGRQRRRGAWRPSRSRPHVTGERHHDRLQPAVPARRPDRDRGAVRRAGLHPGRPSRSYHRCVASSTARPIADFRYLLMPRRLLS